VEASPKRAAFVTIGQAPREDILSEMRPLWSSAVQIEEHGALDGLSETEVETLTPGPTAPRLVSRLADGREVALDAGAVKERTVSLIRRLAETDRHDLIVLLCTGAFGDLPRRPLVVESQRVMDHAVAALAPPASRVGVLVPHAEQATRFAWALPHDTIARHASPYQADSSARLEEAARELASADVDIIALHCMGYGETDRERVIRATGKPALLARRLVASAVAQLL